MLLLNPRPIAEGCPLIISKPTGFCHVMPETFLLYNGIFFFTIIWSLQQRESEEAPFMALCTNLLAILFDIINLVYYWGRFPLSMQRFGATMAIFNLLLRPVSSFLIFRIVQDRAGSYGNFGLPSGLERVFGGPRRSPYEDLDQNPQTNTLPTLDPEHGPSSPPIEGLFTT